AEEEAAAKAAEEEAAAKAAEEEAAAKAAEEEAAAKAAEEAAAAKAAEETAAAKAAEETAAKAAQEATAKAAQEAAAKAAQEAAAKAAQEAAAKAAQEAAAKAAQEAAAKAAQEAAAKAAQEAAARAAQEAAAARVEAARVAELSIPPRITITADNVQEQAGEAVFTATLSKMFIKEVSWEYQTFSGTAEAGSDYLDVAGQIVIPAGQITTQFTIPIIDDLIGEYGEAFSVQFQNPTNQATLTATNITITIEDNDPKQLQVLNEGELNDSFTTATVVERAAFKIAPNLDVGDTTLPWVSINGLLNPGTDWDYFKLDLQSGETVYLDIDYGYDQGLSVDTYLLFYDENQSVLLENDDYSYGTGGSGSVHPYDSYISWTVQSTGAYYVVVKPLNQGRTGDYVLNVSIRPTESSTGLIDPIALDLDEDGIELTTVDSNNLFEMTPDGSMVPSNWLSADDGFLVLDQNQNGEIDDVTELFSEYFQPGIKTGIGALATLDENSDGVIDANDQQFSQLKIWQDHNQDGVSGEGELASIAEYGITQIGLSVEQNSSVIEESLLLSTGQAIKEDGSTINFSEVALAVKKIEGDTSTEGMNFSYQVSEFTEFDQQVSEVGVDTQTQNVPADKKSLEPPLSDGFSVYNDLNGELPLVKDEELI
ncbi:MAG: hypothetical protein HON73_12880, partial [Thiotrichales bacterium]|nr:hypothetical protein [Thiotrichales bacterium]